MAIFPSLLFFGITRSDIRKVYPDNWQVGAIRFSTLESICKALDCQPGDLLEYADDEKTSFV